MSALLHQTLDELAGALLAHVILGQPLSVCETRELATALQVASARARAIEGANVVPWPREKPAVRAVPPGTCAQIWFDAPGPGDAA